MRRRDSSRHAWVAGENLALIVTLEAPRPDLAMRVAEARLSQLATALCSRARACSIGCRVWVLGLEKAGAWLYIPNAAGGP